MPWQRMVADVGGEIDSDTGLPAYREVIVTVPRQSGKTSLILGWELQRAIGWGSPQRIVYSAQSGNDARKKLIEDQMPLLMASAQRQKLLGIRRILKGAGSEAVEFNNGSRIVLLASSEEAGHGKTVDLAVEDELFNDTDFRRDQALGPSMVTKPAAQMLVSSTAGTEMSVALNRAVERGRRSVQEGRRSGVAYFEWSKPDDAGLYDPEAWWRWMPALGHTISVEAIASEAEKQTESDFQRAYGNMMTSTDERAIALHIWVAIRSSGVRLGETIALGLDSTPERSGVSIVAVDSDLNVELIEHEGGSGWVVDRVCELVKRWNAPVAVDPAGPAGSFIRDLEAAGVEVVQISGREMLQACEDGFADIVEGRVSVRIHPALDAAAAGAQKRPVGDAWCWTRRDPNVDVSPIVAMTLASWAVKHHRPTGQPIFAY